MVTAIEQHELGHYKVAQHFGLSPELREREVELHCAELPLKTYLVILVAGAVHERMQFPESCLMSGCGGDARIVCNALHGNNEVAYAAALACIVDGSNARLCIPQEHQELLKAAVQTARDILKE